MPDNDNLGGCVSLEKLFLEGNLFEGSIPSSLSSLRGLEALDLSDNNLSGGIPEFLVNFRGLKYLNLSFNDFEGVLPSEGVFKNASVMSDLGFHLPPHLEVQKEDKAAPPGLRGTIGYAPPEYGMGSELSTKGDVYSYDILLLEMFTGRRPTDERFKEGLSLHNFVKEALPDRLVEIIDPFLLQESVREGTTIENTPGADIMRSDRNLQGTNSIFELGLTCSADSPSERIDMSDVVTKLCYVQDKLLRPTRLQHGIQT
ncbi:hypothetical protein GQ457_09G029560 [Hibiscus cannabinus]